MEDKDPFLNLKQRKFKIKSQQVDEEKSIIKNRKVGRPRVEPKEKLSFYIKKENLIKMNWFSAGYPLHAKRSHIIDMALEELFKRDDMLEYLEKGRKKIEQMQ